VHLELLVRSPLVVPLHGRFDVYYQKQLAEALSPSNDQPYVVWDFSGVEYIDSTALGVMVRMAKRRRAKGYPSVRIAAPKHSVRLLLEVTMLTKIWPTYETIDEAMASFAIDE
jgi:anti-anti-sigma factor